MKSQSIIVSIFKFIYIISKIDQLFKNYILVNKNY